MEWIDYLFYVTGIICWAFFSFKAGRIVTDGIWWAVVDTRRIFKCNLVEGASKWNWCWILPKQFVFTFWETVTRRLDGIERTR